MYLNLSIVTTLTGGSTDAPGGPSPHLQDCRQVLVIVVVQNMSVPYGRPQRVAGINGGRRVLVVKGRSVTDVGLQRDKQRPVRSGTGHPFDIAGEIQTSVLGPLVGLGVVVKATKHGLFFLGTIVLVVGPSGRVRLEEIAVVRVIGQGSQDRSLHVNDDGGFVPDIVQTLTDLFGRKSQSGGSFLQQRKTFQMLKPSKEFNVVQG